jgi:two-component system, chemotaxis family, chemotaxis protein CheY
MPYNLLIVDDSRSLRKVLIKTIRMSHLGETTFFQAGNGKEALEVLSQEWIDIIFTDINMPIMDGYVFIEEVRKNPVFQNTPILVITSEIRKEELEANVGDKVSGILSKPFRPEEIRDYLINLLNLEETFDGQDEDSEGSDF